MDTFEPRRGKKQAWTILLVIEAYLSASLALFIFGPVKWKVDNPGKVLAYVILNYVFLGLGYLWGVKRYLKRSLPRTPAPDSTASETMPPASKRIFFLSALFAIVSWTSMILIIHGGVSLEKLLAVDMGKNYFLALENMAVGINSGVIQIVTLLWVFSYFFLPLGVWYWKSLGLLGKGMFLVAILLDVLYWVDQGTLKGIGDIVVCFISILFLKRISRVQRRTAGMRLLPILIIGFGFFYFFAFSQYQRFRYMGVATDPDTPKFSQLDRNHVLSKISDPVLRTGIIFLDTYLTNGYCGLAGCLEVPFQWTYGIGFSPALMSYAEQYAGLSGVWERHYLMSNEKASGWPAEKNWSTALPWFASDVTFAGVPLVLFFMGFLLARVTLQVLTRRQPVAMALYCQLFIFVVFLPANNQIFQSRQSLIGTFCLFGLYFLVNRREKKKRRRQRLVTN